MLPSLFPEAFICGAKILMDLNQIESNSCSGLAGTIYGSVLGIGSPKFSCGMTLLYYIFYYTKLYKK